MSGPKVLTISREEQQRLAEMERQRIIREERLRIVQDQVRIAETIHRQISSLKNIQGKAALVISHETIPAVVSRVQETISALEKKAEEWSIVSQKQRNEDLQQYVQELRALARQTEQVIQTCDKVVTDTRKTHIDSLLKAAMTPKVKEDTRILVTTEQKRLLDLIQSIRDRSRRVKADHSDELTSIEKEIREVLNGETNDTIKYEKLHRIELARILVVLSTLEKEEKAFDKLDQELSKEIAAYNAACAQYGIVAKKFPFSDTSIREIRNELAAVVCVGNNPVYDQTENMEKLREILSDLGYPYIGQKEEKRGVVRHLYRVHDNVVIHVVYDTSGRVAMEVALEDDSDRAPLSSEVSQIVDEQIEFCRGFGPILEKMQSEGLPLQKDVFYPPDPEFSKVINSSSFEKEEERYEDYSQYEYGNKYLEAKLQ